MKFRDFLFREENYSRLSSIPEFADSKRCSSSSRLMRNSYILFYF